MKSNKLTARVAGALYLAHFVAFGLADLGVHSTPVGPFDSAAAIRGIASSPHLFTLGAVALLLAALFFLFAAFALYVLLRQVDRRVALGFLLLNATGVAIWCASQAGELAAVSLLTSGVQYPVGASEIHGAATVSLVLFQNGFMIAQIFLGLWLFPLGYLVARSRFLPKLLGVLLIVDGFAMLTWFTQSLAAPDLEAIGAVCLTIGLVAEGLLCLWLLIRGIREPEGGSDEQ